MKHILGHDFVEFSRTDWYAYGGADKGSLICYCPDGKTILILSPDNVVSEIVDDEDKTNPNRCTQFDWTRGPQII